MSLDLLSLIQAITRNRGLNPGDYSQTLWESKGKRWGASNILRHDGIGIDKVFQELQCYYPGMFESLDDFVEALAERLGRIQTIYDKYSEEEHGEYEGNKNMLILEAQSHSCTNGLEREVLGDLVERIKPNGRKVKLTKNGVKEVLRMAIEEE